MNFRFNQSHVHRLVYGFFYFIMDCSNEIWKPIPDYESYYQVSSFGRIKSLSNNKYKKEKILKNVINSDGYYVVSLSKSNFKKCIPVHKLVAICFLNHDPCGMEYVVDHINENKLDNNVSNLQIVTTYENNVKSKKNKTSKYIGVSYHKNTNKWVSAISYKGERKSLGYFDCQKEAHEAYVKAFNAIKGYNKC